MSIEDIKKIPILDVASKLNVAFKYKKTLCPLGHDKTPSLSVKVESNYFKCFGCGVSGSVIDFVMLYKNLTLIEAIKWLETQNKSVKSFTNKKAITEKNFTEVYRYFVNLLSAEEAIKYLKKRGIKKEITEQAEIKAITCLESVKSNLLKKFNIELLKEAGLWQKDFVFTNHRLIIPYFDTNGNIVNLQGRNIDNETEPKYKFLAGIPVCLYNIKALKNAKTVYLCEGVIDVLSCYQLGLETPIGVAGVNNFKDDYFTLLEQYKIIIASDKDKAGKKFYLQVKEEFLKRGKQIYALDYQQLKKDYNVTTDVKDLNDIVSNSKPQEYYSEVLKDTFIKRNNVVIFKSGVTYTQEEIKKLKGVKADLLQKIHIIKKVFKGVLVC